MNKPELIPGTVIDGDIYIGRINVNGAHKGILLPPKTVRQFPEPVIWNKKSIKGATSWNDGQANTKDMADAGSKLAKWALDNNMHIPSLDELEIIYRTCKPTTRENSLWTRSGINVSAVPPTYPYTETDPAQTTLEQFRAGEPEAFDTDDWYWSSTRHQGDEGYAWYQLFSYGSQTTTTSAVRASAARSAGSTSNFTIPSFNHSGVSNEPQHRTNGIHHRQLGAG